MKFGKVFIEINDTVFIVDQLGNIFRMTVSALYTTEKDNDEKISKLSGNLSPSASRFIPTPTEFWFKNQKWFNYNDKSICIIITKNFKYAKKVAKNKLLIIIEKYKNQLKQVEIGERCSAILGEQEGRQ